MKLIVLLALVSVAAAAKLDQLEGQAQAQGLAQSNDQTHTRSDTQDQPRRQRPIVEIIKNERVAPLRGAYSTDFETEDGVVFSEHGQAGSAGQSNVQGTYSYVSPEGEVIEVSYVADELGFRVESPFIPTPHPVPAHVQLQIDFAKEQERLKGEEQQV